ncbi:MAG: MIP family channel protein [Anaerovoracaceae bacterium]|jgi:aquaporin Z
MKKYIAEFIGTLVLVFIGCGAAVAANTLVGSMGLTIPLGFTTLLIAFAFGLSIVAMAYSIGNVSGCHVNPAVSLGMLVAGRMSVKDFIGYVVAQFLGATAAAAILMNIFQSNKNLGQNGYGANSALGIDMSTAVLVECILTFIFVLVVLGVTDKEKYAPTTGLVIGLSLTLVHLFGIPFTGTSVNPARSFGPAIFVQGDALQQLPVFIIAPLIGGVVAALVYRFVLRDKKEKKEEEAAA